MQPVQPVQPVQAPPAGPQPAWQAAPAAAAQPIPELPRDPTARNHDGFYLRMALGLGKGWFSLEETNAPGSFDANGLAAEFALQLGGTLGSGFVLGGGIVATALGNPTIESNGETYTANDVSIGLSQFQLFGVYYPDPKAGFFIQASVGYAELQFKVGDRNFETNTSGIALGGGVGYDFWVSDQWSIGPALLITHGILSGDEANTNYSASFTAPTLAFTGTYH